MKPDISIILDNIDIFFSWGFEVILKYKNMNSKIKSGESSENESNLAGVIYKALKNMPIYKGFKFWKVVNFLSADFSIIDLYLNCIIIDIREMLLFTSFN